jgi:hypothetical protein
MVLSAVTSPHQMHDKIASHSFLSLGSDGSARKSKIFVMDKMPWNAGAFFVIDNSLTDSVLSTGSQEFIFRWTRSSKKESLLVGHRIGKRSYNHRDA